MRQFGGSRVLVAGTRPVTRRHHQIVSRRRDCRVWLVLRDRVFWMEWLRLEGWAVIGIGRMVGRDITLLKQLDRPGWEKGMKRRVVKGSDLILPLLSRETAVLKKLPDLVAFVGECAYDDNTMRTPGYITLRNRLHCYEITLYDPDAGLRIALRAQTLDDVLKLANEAVTAEGLPWEPDKYLQEQLAEKEKKSSRTSRKK